MYLLDSDICIGLLRGTLTEGYEWFSRYTVDEIMLPAVVEAEVRLGTRKKKSPSNQQVAEDFLAPFRIVPFDSACAEKYAELRADLEAKSTPIGPNDMMVAATALAHDATLVTNDVREYKRVPHLKVETFDLVDLP